MNPPILRQAASYENIRILQGLPTSALSSGISLEQTANYLYRYGDLVFQRS